MNNDEKAKEEEDNLTSAVFAYDTFLYLHPHLPLSLLSSKFLLNMIRDQR